MPKAHPRLNIHLTEAAARNETARRVISEASATMPALAEIWQLLGNALADVPRILDEVSRLSAELASVRLDRANLLAAVRARLAARDDGEPDPVSYLRDELDAQRAGSQRRPA